MADDSRTEHPDETSEREVYGVGDAIDWEAPWEKVVLWVELPFWLMVPDGPVTVEVRGHQYDLQINSDFSELHAEELLDSKARCLYVGRLPAMLAPELVKELDEQQTPVMPRKCKTVLRIRSRCNADVLAAASEGNTRRQRDYRYYLSALCEAHLEIVNVVIQQYRLATYDYFPHEVSPWDVPIWAVQTDHGLGWCLLLPYAGWDVKPQIGAMQGPLKEYELISSSELQSAFTLRATAGEFELLDARTLMERGDYSGAVRRITTALEVITEAVVAEELGKLYADDEVERRLLASRNDFPGRVRQYEKLSGRRLPPALWAEIESTRATRHAIVHGGLRISFNERGRAQRSVDTGRWAFNWFENKAERTKLRETKLATKSIGRHMTIAVFDAELTNSGAVVHKPPFLEGDDDNGGQS